MWVIGARPGRSGVPGADPDGNFAFPLAGSYRGDMISLNTGQVNLQFSFGPVPLRSLDFRGRLDDSGRFRPGSTVYGRVTCGSVPNYSAYLYAAGVCNADDTLAAYGTFLSHGYDARGDANRRPRGVRAGSVTLRAPTATADGEAVAGIALDSGARFRAGSHLASLLLVDGESGRPVSLDYRTLTRPTTDAKGNVSEVRLTIPAGTSLPSAIRAYVIADVFPLAVRDLAPERDGGATK